MNDIVLNLLYISGGLMILALILNFVRFMLGPSLVDRIIAFDVLTVGSLGLMGLVSVLDGRLIYLDVSIIYGLLSFVAVIVVGKYIAKSL
jgi:multicomponent Na+:H+ antiporter subunit F